MADKTKTIVFTADQTYGTIPPVEYTAGQIVTLREDLADRWINRGVATEAPGEIAKAKRGEKPQLPVETLPAGVPVGWATLGMDALRDLAVKLGAKPEEVEVRAQSHAYVLAKVEAHKAAAKDAAG